MKGMGYRLYWYLAALILTVLSYPLNASETRLMQFSKISLPYEANVVEHVYKDSQGMMWFATRRGVFSYDGYSIRRLFEGNFYSVAATGDKTLCFGGDTGLRWLDLTTEQFVSPYGDVPETGEVRSMACHDGILYVGTKARGLFSLDLKKKMWQRYMLPKGKNDIIFSFEFVGDQLYIAHYNGLACLDSKGNIRDAGIEDNVYALWYDPPRGHLWIGTEHGLLRRDVSNGSTTTVLTGSTFNQVVPSPTGEILLASEFGLEILDPKTGGSRTISHDASAPGQGLPSNTIHQIYCEGNIIWIATDRGIALTQSENTFETMPLPSISGSRDGNVFTQILVDSRGDRWLGGDNGLLHISSRGTKWFKVGSGLRKSIIRKIYEDNDHDIWIATDAGIAKYDPRRDAFSYFALTDWKGRNANWAYDIYEDRKGFLWIATYMGGLYIVDKKALLSSGGTYAMREHPLSKWDDIVNTIYMFQPDERGVLWANTCKGLAAINTNDMTVSLKQKLFPDKMILANGAVWLDIQGRLFRYDISSDRKEETDFMVKDGMIQAFVQEGGRVWMSTSDGLYYVDTSDSKIHTYSKQVSGFTAGVYVQAGNTILWGGEDIVCRQQVRPLSSGQSPSRVYLSSVLVGGLPVENCVPRFCKTIELSGREDIMLGLSTFSYDSKGAEVFWYKIDEDGEWHSLPNGTNKIMLSHLTGGTYRLFLSSDAGHSDGSVTEYLIKVPRPWFLRWWAWLGYLLVAGLAIGYLLYYYRRREKRRFEQRERERVMTLTQQKIDFFVDMSHELKTPLSLIIAPLSKLLSETSNAKLRDSLKSIQNNATRLNDLIHRILDFKQLEAEGENHVLGSRIDLCSLVGSCLDEFGAAARERNVSINFQTPDEPVLLDADAVKIQTVVRNIMSNAMKYVDDGKGRIDVCVRKGTSDVSVSISDNGPGVHGSDLAKLFNRYYMGQNAREGTGVGLSIVKKYVELHGGEVKAENEDGLTVTFSLPLHAASSVNTGETECPEHQSEMPVVLIVDDNQEILEFLSTALGSSYNCLTAYSGEEAINVMKDTVPDLVITDEMMPGINGIELCQRIRHEHSTKLIPIIMLTAKDDTETELKSIRSGADVFMPKPFDLRKLQLHIVQLLNKRKAIEQNTRIEGMVSVQALDSVASNDEELMERVISLIDSNMQSEEFNVTKLCSLLCMDQKQLYRKLKQLTGETPVSFIRKQRMKRAAALLKQERFTVSEVMYQVGFSSASYFSKSFIKEFGVSPKDFANH